MARPIKVGLDYFPFDTDFFSDRKVKILRARYGADGITVYLYLLCTIYREGYYLKLDDDLRYIIADDLNMSGTKIGQIVHFLLERSLFSDTLFQSDKVLTSEGIQRRYQKAVEGRAKKTAAVVDERYWLLSEEETAAFLEVRPKEAHAGENTGFSAQKPAERRGEQRRAERGRGRARGTRAEIWPPDGCALSSKGGGAELSGRGGSEADWDLARRGRGEGQSQTGGPGQLRPGREREILV